ncbi:MAG: nitroreductase family protein [Desulfobacterales bacterium]
MSRLIPLLAQRRSIRRFEDRAVPPEMVAQIVEAALRAPSSRSLNPWEFIVVRDRVQLKRLAQAKPQGCAFLGQAPLGIVICADPQRCDVWIEDASIATLLIHLAATDLGLGSCWVQIRKRMHDDRQSAAQYIARELDLPEGMEVLAAVAIGYPQESKSGHSPESLPYAKVHGERFGRDFRPE